MAHLDMIAEIAFFNRKLGCHLPGYEGGNDVPAPRKLSHHESRSLNDHRTAQEKFAYMERRLVERQGVALKAGYYRHKGAPKQYGDV